jgi:magnesium chelatase family protein
MYFTNFQFLPFTLKHRGWIAKKFSGNRLGESSETIRTRVQTARNIQLKRFSTIGSPDIVVFNADICIGEIRQFCKQPEEDYSLMRAVMTQLNLSARAYHRVIKLARTIAYLAGSDDIQSVHLAEALHTVPMLFGSIS